LRLKSKSSTQVGATLERVARAAGVSAATVSRYFNSPDVVAEATAARIREAVERYSYVPNLLAGGLASSRTRLVAMVIPEISQPIFSSTIQSIADALTDGGYSVLLGLTGTSDEHADRQLVSIIGRRPDGIILTGSTLRQEARQRLRDTGISTIETWDLPRDPIDLTVGFSHRNVGREVARHALAAGRRRALMISAGGQRALERRDGFFRAMAQGGACEPVLATFGSSTTYGHGRSAVALHLDSGGKPDLVVCSSDWSAHGALDELKDRGIRVPEDVAVIGFGDLSFSAELKPSLTTVKIDGSVIGREAVKLLTLRAQDKKIQQPVVDVGFSIVVRDSA
jgi:LacI family gluconate utilization system Gnt-I transcriptional repressor